MPLTLEIPYPFCRTTYGHQAEDGWADVPTWRPGVDHQLVTNYGDVEVVCHGMGHMLLSEVQRVSFPFRYQDRVFYVRQWRDPDGRTFGKTILRVTTAKTFERLAQGYRYPFACVSIREVGLTA